ncbi:uncharacterized protein LOC123562602 [Mercenaria mercenaria]|uniref:uncharacterized protein LOC123562602 n=1 Tax=Mercenaria mercenaria TaxID=6596 RepID=UPI001E1D23B5|nr:uncharacterized protein LOC123562602 [Mercenaria mercenaria]
MFSRTAIFVILFLSFILQVYCGSYWGKLKRKRLKGNRFMEYCETREGMMLFKGSTVKFKNCYVCTCTKKGLDCKTSYGVSLFGYSNCKTVIDDCKTLLVDRTNEYRRCYSGLPTNQKVPKEGYEEVAVHGFFFG